MEKDINNKVNNRKMLFVGKKKLERELESILQPLVGELKEINSKIIGIGKKWCEFIEKQKKSSSVFNREYSEVIDREYYEIINRYIKESGRA